MPSRYLSAWIMLVFLSSVTIDRLHASNAVPLQEARTVLLEKTSEQLRAAPGKHKKAERLIKKIDRKLSKKNFKSALEVDFTDPVNKWLWFGIFGLGVAIVLSIFDLGLGGLVAFAAVVCLVIWLVKLNSAA